MYTTQEAIENYLLTTIDDVFDEQVDAWILAAQKWIENYTDRNFEAVDEIRKFDGNGECSLYVDDLLAVEEITVKWGTTTETLDSTDYLLYQNDNANRTPYNKIALDIYGNYLYFYKGMQNVSVEGTWGYSETAPADIQLVCTKLVASIINAGKNGQISEYTEGDLSIKYQDFDKIASQDVAIYSVLDFYKRPAKLTGFSIQRV